MSELTLSSWFFEAIPRASAREDADALEAALRAAIEGARTALPELALDEAAFIRHLAACTKGSADPVPAVRDLHAPDLALSWACARGDAWALAELDRRLVAVVGPAVARLHASQAFVQEVQQLLRQRLLLPGPSGQARIFDYAGRGPLSRWLRAAALRVGLNLLEAQKPDDRGAEGTSALSHMPAVGPDPELALVKQRYGPEFKAALESALQGLSARERNFLRLYFVQGLTVDQIGQMQGTHKSTVSRWLARSREALLDEVRRQLRERLQLSASELDSLMGLLRSELDLSLLRVLA